jgi:hypothetical protein
MQDEIGNPAPSFILHPSAFILSESLTGPGERFKIKKRSPELVPILAEEMTWLFD